MGQLGLDFGLRYGMAALQMAALFTKPQHHLDYGSLFDGVT